jgi:peptide/nickel transport system substrate-binding protein
VQGQGAVAGQLLPDGFFGASRKLAPIKHDPDAAKRLLTDAGYPNGFAITLHTPRGRYPQAEPMAEAIAEMLTRVGIETRVEALPPDIFASRGARSEFSLLLAQWSTGLGEAAAPLAALVASVDPQKGTGLANRGRYANPALDAVLAEALQTVDDAAREKLLIEASEIAVQDNAVIPILHNLNVWAMQDGVTYEPRADGRTLATGAKPKG